MYEYFTGCKSIVSRDVPALKSYKGMIKTRLNKTFYTKKRITLSSNTLYAKQKHIFHSGDNPAATSSAAAFPFKNSTIPKPKAIVYPGPLPVMTFPSTINGSPV